MNLKNINLNDLKQYALYPLRALSSKTFYFEILFKLKGIGFVYLFLLSMAVAVPASYKVSVMMDMFRSIELPSLVARLPPSFLNASGVLVPNDKNDAYVLLKNSSGKPALVYNVNDKPLEGEALQAPVELGSRAITFNSSKGKVALSYTEVFETNTAFSPLESARMVDAIFNVSIPAIWTFVSLWFFMILAVNAVIIGVIAKFILLFVGKVKTGFANVLRLSSFANTIVALLLLLQYYVYIEISYSLIALLPLLYILLFSREFKKQLDLYGAKAFVKKYSGDGSTLKAGPKDTESYEETESRRQKIDELTGNNDNDLKTDGKKSDNDKGSGFFEP